jgi:hypothetical protein
LMLEVQNVKRQIVKKYHWKYGIHLTPPDSHPAGVRWHRRS